MGKRSTARKLAMQALYQFQIQKANQEDILEYTIHKDSYIKETQDFASEIYNGVLSNEVLIDTLIAKYSIDWKIDRIASIDKAILRVGVWEMLFTNSSVKVIISESIELIRKYSAHEAIKFINGVLGSVAVDRGSIQETNKIEVICLPE